MTTFFATLAVTLLAFTAIWAASLGRRDASIIDFYWGPGFVVIGWLAFALSGSGHPVEIALLLMLTAWGLRLGWYMVARHHGAEDARYAAMRAEHGAAFPIRSLWMVFWLQAVIQWLAASPILVVMTAPVATRAAVLTSPILAVLAALGTLLFVAGFLLEVLADREVARFKADPANRGKLLVTGLHARIRHPNYLGEIILQWGIGLVALALTGNPLALAGSALMTGLIVRLSGVPMLEAQLATRPGYAAWKARTGALWPRWGT